MAEKTHATRPREAYTMSQHKYLVMPGWVYSADGDEHWITASQLIKLYGVKPSECLVNQNADSLRGYSNEYIQSLKHLWPLSSGNYPTRHQRVVTDSEGSDVAVKNPKSERTQ
jgi:hypothetical protein